MSSKLRISTELLRRVLFGDDEIIIRNVNDMTDLGYVELVCDANPDLGLGNGEFIVRYRTEVRIIERKYIREA